ncbi:MAG: NTP transferase domain-containing protein [Deltaproteobacteria bacterium]|nr:NTP transferase domain-containing protein [Deltaproteobacteria bacterium]
MSSVDRLILLAAGRGSRLVAGGEVPKPLVPVCGEPLIVRILRAYADAGVREAVVVVGFRGGDIRAALRGRRNLGLKVELAVNTAWERSNGLSVLAAAPFLDGPALLAMADHLVTPDMVAKVAASRVRRDALVLGVDRRIHECFDIDDATKVKTDAAGRIVAIGKTLEDYDCIDTGVFRISQTLVDALRGVVEARGDASLSQGVSALASRGLAFVQDVGDAFWLDVDTPEAWTEATRALVARGDASTEIRMPGYVRAATGTGTTRAPIRDMPANDGRV